MHLSSVAIKDNKLMWIILKENLCFTLWACNLICYSISQVCIPNNTHQIFDCGKSFHIEYKVYVLSFRSNVRSIGRSMNKELVLVTCQLKMLTKRSMRVTSKGRSQSLIGRYLLFLHHYVHAIKWTCINYSSTRKTHVQSVTLCFRTSI